jgi:hypothetical protein
MVCRGLPPTCRIPPLPSTRKDYRMTELDDTKTTADISGTDAGNPEPAAFTCTALEQAGQAAAIPVNATAPRCSSRVTAVLNYPGVLA